MRVLVVIQGGLRDRMSGPEIRGWALATSLAESHTVTVAIDDPREASRDGVRLISNRRRELVSEARRHDAVVAAGVAPYLLTTLRHSTTVTVSDQYDPVWLETSVLSHRRGVARLLRAQLMMRDAQVRFADVIAVAGQAQRDLLLRELEDLAVPRAAYPRIVTVPFGLPDPPEPTARRPLRAAFPAIGEHDPVVLWWGKVWKWFDAETAIRAFALVAARRPDARLVISAGKAPTAADVSDRTDAAREVSRSLGLLDRNVLFLDEWTPYDRRHEYLLEADIGLTLHGDTAEAPFAARARYMDYLWTALPCVLGSGDETASAFGDAGFASLVAPADVNGTASALMHLLENPSARESARVAGARLAEQYRWSAIVKPLAHAIEECHATPRRAPSKHLLRTVSRYYLHRTIDHAAAIVRSAG